MVLPQGVPDAVIGAYKDTYDPPQQREPILGKFSPLFVCRYMVEFEENPGRDITSKTAMWGARGAVAGFAYGLVGLCRVRNNQSFPRMVGGLGYMTGVGVLAGVTGAAALTATQAIREKNDEIAWGIGGLAAGFSTCAFSLDWRSGIFRAAFLGISTFALKNCGYYGYPDQDENASFKWENRRVPFYRLIGEDGKMTQD